MFVSSKGAPFGKLDHRAHVVGTVVAEFRDMINTRTRIKVVRQEKLLEINQAKCFLDVVFERHQVRFDRALRFFTLDQAPGAHALAIRTVIFLDTS